MQTLWCATTQPCLKHNFHFAIWGYLLGSTWKQQSALLFSDYFFFLGKVEKKNLRSQQVGMSENRCWQFLDPLSLGMWLEEQLTGCLSKVIDLGQYSCFHCRVWHSINVHCALICQMIEHIGCIHCCLFFQHHPTQTQFFLTIPFQHCPFPVTLIKHIPMFQKQNNTDSNSKQFNPNL